MILQYYRAMVVSIVFILNKLFSVITFIIIIDIILILVKNTFALESTLLTIVNKPLGQRFYVYILLYIKMISGLVRWSSLKLLSNSVSGPQQQSQRVISLILVWLFFFFYYFVNEPMQPLKPGLVPNVCVTVCWHLIVEKIRLLSTRKQGLL